MADIFLSYARADQPRIERLAEALEEAGYTLWWDRHIEGGQHFAKDIEREITAAKAVIVAWSGDSIESNWVLDEASYARDEKKLVPLSLDGTQPPFGYRQIQSLDFTGWPEDDGGFARLQSALAKLMDGEAPAAPSPTTAPATPQRPWAKPLIALIALIVVAGGAWWFLSGSDGADSEFAAQADYQKSVAVLPFEDLSPDASDNWFAAGLAEEIAFALGRTPDLKVAATTATRALVDADVATNEMADQLAVAHFLQGSVRRAGDDFRITVTLFKDDGTQVWTERYDRPTNAAIEVQEEIATQVARALGTALDPEALAEMVETGTNSIAAYEALLRASAIPGFAGRDDEVFALIDQAIAADPDFAAPHILKLDVLRSRFLLGTYSNSNTGSVQSDWQAYVETTRKAKALAMREVDERSINVNRANLEYRFGDALEDLEWVRSNYPHWTGPVFEQSSTKLRMGRVGNIRDDVEALSKLNPDDRDGMLQMVWLSRDEDYGVELSRKFLAESDQPGMLYQAQRLLLRAGKIDEGSEVLERLKASGVAKNLWEMSGIRQACAEGRREDALAMFAARDDRSVGGDYQTYQIFGMHEEARALIAPYDTAEPPYALAYMSGTPYFDPDHAPNIARLMQREGIPLREPYLGIYCPPEGDSN